MNCYCRGVATCPNCEGHICTGQCTCAVDGAPHTQEAVTAGHVNPSQARQDAWAEKLELTR
jgi:hypothetical protein